MRTPTTSTSSRPGPASATAEATAPEALVIDLDGTLLNRQGRVSDRSREALKRAREAGLRAAVASARPWRLITDVLGEDLQLFDAAIVSNGSTVLAMPNLKVIDETLLPASVAVEVIATVSRCWPDAAFGWELGGEFGCNEAFAALAGKQRIIRDVHRATPRALPDAPVHQLVFARPGYEPADLLASTAALLDAGHVATDSKGGVVEISAAAANKASAALAWVTTFGAGLEHVVAFGDELNDIALLRAAGLGVAMGNANPAVKKAAALTAGSHDADGVAEVIESLLSVNPPIAAAASATRTGQSE